MYLLNYQNSAFYFYQPLPPLPFAAFLHTLSRSANASDASSPPFFSLALFLLAGRATKKKTKNRRGNAGKLIKQRQGSKGIDEYLVKWEGERKRERERERAVCI